MTAMNDQENGLSPLTAALFIFGEIAGTGILAFPFSFRQIHWFGVVAIVICGLVTGYASNLLGKCWLKLERREMRIREASSKVRMPYALIGYYSTGYFGYYSTNITLILMLFGSSVVQLLVCAETVQSLTKDYVDIQFCFWIAIIATLLLPIFFLGSPVDFAPVAYFAMSSTTIAAVLIIIAIFMEPESSTVTNCPEEPITFKGVFLAVSTLLFGYGGAGVLPTIQNDMQDKKLFKYSVFGAFGLMIIEYIPVSSVAYHKFGNCVQANVLRNLSNSWIKFVIQILMVAHCCCALLIDMNPVNLTVEDCFRINHSFNLTRCLMRICMMAAIVLTGWTVPKFNKLIDLIGSFSVTMQSLILPVIFYYIVQRKRINFRSKLSLTVILIISVFVAIASTIYSAIEVVDPRAFTLPCYACSFKYSPRDELNGTISSTNFTRGQNKM